MITENRAKEREHEAYLRGRRVGLEMYSGDWETGDVLIWCFVVGVIAFASGMVLGMLIVGTVHDFIPGCSGWPTLFTPIGFR